VITREGGLIKIHTGGHPTGITATRFKKKKKKKKKKKTKKRKKKEKKKKKKEKKKKKPQRGRRDCVKEL